MQHIAFNVDTMEDLLAMRDRIRSRDINVMGPINHGMCHSIYFAGLENLTLEVSTSGAAEAPLDKKGTWIDPEVAELVGINDEELKRYMSPADYSNDGEPLTNPGIQPNKPQMTYPDGVWERIIGAPDDALLESLESAPPSPNGI